ncbi:MAG: O-antigen ligase family protein [Rhodospirillales bacterium]|nr:O-antigen ligase family protein [Rhodospirillales bacterium]
MLSRPVTSLVLPAKVSYRQMLTNSAILIFSLVFTMLLFMKMGGVVRLLYPVAAISLAGALFFTNRAQYVAFVIWLFMITPFVRRVVDYQAGWIEANPVTLASILAAAISLIVLIKKLPVLYRISYIPFILILIACLYGFFVGCILSGPVPAAYDLLLWIVPIAFGFGIASDWKNFPDYRDAIFKTFLWGGAIMGAYGVYQYFFLPAWDAAWMRSTTITSIGYPFPMRVRVFSTMNSPTAYGAITMPSLVIILVTSGILRYLTAVCALGGFVLCIVRTAWLGWMISVAFLVFKLRGTRRAKLVFGLFAIAVICLPVLTTGSIGEKFAERLSTFNDLEGDKSYVARSELYHTLTERALTNVWGTGTGAVGIATKLNSATTTVTFNIDSGLLFVPYTLGWPGAILILIGISALMLRPPGIIDRENESVVQAATGICVAMIAMMASYNSMYGVGGMVFWSFMGLRLCARQWSATR